MVHFSHFHLYISIHAPTRGATKFKRTSCNNYNISIHAPTRGATVYLCYYDIFHLYFNPRSHEGSDGRTSFTFFFSGVFQSTLPRGERQVLDGNYDNKVEFQSTLPRGERPGEVREVATLFKFQSTLPRGERLTENMVFIILYRFQSTLPRGERRGSFFSGLWGIINFNPRSHEGSDAIDRKSVV